MATIIVMEDDPIVRDLVVRVLEMKGFTVHAFEDARPALETVDFEHVDLIITDLQMPTSGEDAIQTIRRRGIRTPVLVMSGHIDEPEVGEIKALGVQEVIRKPFKLLDLLETVQKWI